MRIFKEGLIESEENYLKDLKTIYKVKNLSFSNKSPIDWSFD
jgi:hypothetical protein